jgi:hypothetical protein
MTEDGRGAPAGETPAVRPDTGGPAGVPDAAPATLDHPAFPEVHPGLTAPGYRQRLAGAPPRPAPPSRSTRVLAGTRAKEVPMV